ncbi:MAG: flavin reductase [Clostridia bacterium]|nr:flavin reductase [Clostridia bacterium]
MDKTALYKLSYGLFVLSAKDGDRDNGCIVNTVTQLTTEPNIISVAVNKQNHTRDMILKTGAFNVSILTESVPMEIIKRFGFQSGRDADKLLDFSDYARTNDGLFYLNKHANAVINAEVTGTRELSTHTLFLAYVNTAQTLSDEPSVTYDYYQKNIKPHPQKTAKKGWRCKVCGYVYEGDDLPADFICPWCKHGADDFEQI